MLFKLNVEKSQSNNMVSDLVQGDKVRLKITAQFKKGSEEQFSRNIYC